MASQWHSLISQKIYLANVLLDQHSSDAPVTTREALWQGAAELGLRSRQLLMVMIARFYQAKKAEPKSFDELKATLGDSTPEITELEALGGASGNWWSYLNQIESHQQQPAAPKKTVSEENIIAIAADTGPDRSPQALKDALTELKHFIDVLEDRHSEW